MWWQSQDPPPITIVPTAYIYAVEVVGLFCDLPCTMSVNHSQVSLLKLVNSSTAIQLIIHVVLRFITANHSTSSPGTISILISDDGPLCWVLVVFDIRIHVQIGVARFESGLDDIHLCWRVFLFQWFLHSRWSWDFDIAFLHLPLVTKLHVQWHV